MCLDSLSCRLLLWQLGRDICSAQPCAVGVDDHTFLTSILKHFLSRKISQVQPPLRALVPRGWAAQRWGQSGWEMLEQEASPAPSSLTLDPQSRKDRNLPVMFFPLLCNYDSLLQFPIFNWIGNLESQYRGEKKKKKSQPLCLTQASVFVYYSRLLSYFVNSMKTRISWIKKMFCPCWLLCLSMSISRCPGLPLQGSLARVAPCRRWYK